MFTAPLPSNRSLLLRGAEITQNTSTLFLTARVCWTVYRAVAWQRVDQICNNIKEQTHIEIHNETAARVCWTVYRAVAWQHVDQICNNIKEQTHIEIHNETVI
jgi:metal-dependent amidase/aminoacylase/carboxypeptidase family protein